MFKPSSWRGLRPKIKPQARREPPVAGAGDGSNGLPFVGAPLVNVFDQDLVDFLAPAAMDLETADDCASFSATEWLRIWYVRSWPRRLGYERWQTILRFSEDLRISMFMEPLPPGMVMKQLEQQETAIQAGRYVREKQKRDPSPGDDQKLVEIREERRFIEIDGDPFYHVTVVIGLFAGSREQLDAASTELENQCRNCGLTIDRAKWQHEHGMLALLPHNMNTLGNHHRNARLETLTNMFPFLGDEIVMPGGIYYGVDLQSKMSVVIDPFRLENPNCIIIGTSGGGKSYWMKDLIEQCVLDGMRVFVLDIEDEYRHLCNDLGGLYLDMGHHSKHKINVLDPDPADPEGLAGAYETFKGWFITALGRGMVAQEAEMFDKAYFAAFAAKGIKRDDPSTLLREPPLLQDLFNELISQYETDPALGGYARTLASVLAPMAGEGGEADAFDCQTNVDVRSNPLVVFGLNTVKPPMMPRRIRQIQQFTWNQMGKGQRTVEIVDEAWWLLQNPDTADDLSQRARRFRKKNAALFIATQHPEDFAANRHAHAVLNMVATHLLFGQNATSLDQIAAIFKLNAQEKRSLGTLRPGQYFLKTSRLRALMFKPVPDGRDRLYTTVPEEVVALKAQLAAEEAAERAGVDAYGQRGQPPVPDPAPAE